MTRPTKKQIATAIKAFAPEGRIMPAHIEKAAARKSGGNRKRPEDALQITCCEWLDLQKRCLYWATPNHLLYIKNATGAQLAFMAKQKRMGLAKGALDLNIIFRHREHGNMVLILAELKCGSNQLTKEQHAFSDRANALGAHTLVVRDVTDLIDGCRAAGL